MTQAPFFSLEAVVTGRRISTMPPLPTSLLLLFHGRDGAGTVSAINAAVRAALRSLEAITIASVVDLHRSPSLLRPALTLALEGAYRRAARHLPADLPPEDALVILPDWEGAVTQQFGMADRPVPVGMVAICRDGSLAGSYVGSEPVANALHLARQITVVEPIS